MDGFLTVDGVRLSFSDNQHKGVPLVALHAIGHDGRDYLPLAERLAERRVITIDWPDQGRSSSDQVAPSARRYEELLRGALDQLGLARAILVGNSIGGATAIRFAAAHPERVESLVLMNPGGLDSGGWLSRLAIRLMVAFFSAGARGAGWFPRAFALYYKMVLRRPAAAAVRERIVSDGRKLASLLAAAWRGFGESDANLRSLAPRVTCKVLFAWARHDRFIQLGRCSAAIARFPHARIETFDAGHAPQIETPDELAASIAQFLDENKHARVAA